MSDDAPQFETVRYRVDGAVATITLARPDKANAMSMQLIDEVDAAFSLAGTDPAVRVVVLDAEGRNFCSGHDLAELVGPDADPAIVAERATAEGKFAQEKRMYVDRCVRIYEFPKPTIAAVQGWCIAGGTDMVLNVDLIVAAESARFGYPPARVWGVPEAPWVWVARLGLERAKRYLFTGDELTAREAADAGMILECVPDDALDARAVALADRMALLPLNQLQMMKWMLNDVARHQYQPDTSRLLGFIFDGVARHTQEGLDFVERAQEVGWREVIRERDRPFGDYGERDR